MPAVRIAAANLPGLQGCPLSFDTPVLLIAWRRPDTTRQVINSLRPLAPSSIFVASDGPLDQGIERQKVEATRQLVKQEIDWPCELQLFQSEANLGGRYGISSFISWFFEHVEAGIILEDDCVVRADFLPFCAELLERYRHDRRIWSITGTNYQDGQWRGPGSYYFSHYHHSWGWATWRDRWQANDPDLGNWPRLKASGLMETIFQDPVECAYWSGIWDRMVEEGKPATWDYPWALTCFANGGLTATPNTTLVTNVGYGADSTHTQSDGPLNTMGSEAILPLRHPPFILRDVQADRYTFDHWFRGLVLRNQMDQSLNRRLRRGLRRAWQTLQPQG